MEYQIIESEYSDYIRDEIVKKLKEGWACVGGISITCYTYKDHTNYDAETHQMIYAQALVRGEVANHEKVISFLAHAKDSCNNAMALGIRVGDFIEHNPEIFSEYRKPS